MKLNVKEMAVFGMLGALMFASKLLMEVAPNIHLLGVFTMAFTIVYRKKALYPIYIYVLLNGIFSGFATWWVPYLYLWTILIDSYGWRQSTLIAGVVSLVIAIAAVFFVKTPDYVKGLDGGHFGLDFGNCWPGVFTGLPGQETFKAETVRGQPGKGQRRQHC